MAVTSIHAVGRRKRAVARVYLRPGSGIFKINRREGETYLNNSFLRMKARKPFEVLGVSRDSFDIFVNVVGGGVNGQTDAITLAVARALQFYNPEYRPALKKEGMLTVDARKVERKKYGRRKARKRFQFSKR